MLNKISHSFAFLTREIVLVNTRNKFHISAHSCIILYLFFLSVILQNHRRITGYTDLSVRDLIPTCKNNSTIHKKRLVIYQHSESELKIVLTLLGAFSLRVCRHRRNSCAAEFKLAFILCLIFHFSALLFLPF